MVVDHTAEAEPNDQPAAASLSNEFSVAGSKLRLLSWWLSFEVF